MTIRQEGLNDYSELPLLLLVSRWAAGNFLRVVRIPMYSRGVRSRYTVLGTSHWGEAGSHDDGPDALEMLWRAVTDGSNAMGHFQTTGRYRPGYDPERTGDTPFSQDGFGVVSGAISWQGY